MSISNGQTAILLSSSSLDTYNIILEQASNIYLDFFSFRPLSSLEHASTICLVVTSFRHLSSWSTSPTATRSSSQVSNIFFEQLCGACTSTTEAKPLQFWPLSRRSSTTPRFHQAKRSKVYRSPSINQILQFPQTKLITVEQHGCPGPVG